MRASIPVLLLALVLVGCPKKGPAPGSPAAVALTEDEECKKDLAEPGHAEARAWCGASKSMGFKVSCADMLELTNQLHEHGATAVDVVGIETMGERELSACMVATLPVTPASRKGFFEWYTPWAKEHLEEEEPADYGQKYVRISLD